MIADDNGSNANGAGSDLERRLVDSLEQLPGVIAASIRLAGPDQLRALDITAAQRASTVIVTNAAARILHRHHVTFDPRMIHVSFQDGVHPAPVKPRTPAPDSPGVFALEDLTLLRSGNRVTCKVAIRREHDLLDGEATELDTEAGRVRAAARATLAAAESVQPSLALGLEGSALLDLFGRRYVAVSVEAALDRRFAVLAGLAPVESARSPEESACIAALRAIDRWIFP